MIEGEEGLPDFLAQLFPLLAHILRKLVVLPTKDRTPEVGDAPHPEAKSKCYEGARKACVRAEGDDNESKESVEEGQDDEQHRETEATKVLHCEGDRGGRDDHAPLVAPGSLPA